MTTATKPATKPAKPRARRVREPGTVDYLQHALEDLNHAREHAQKEARTGIDAASERIRAAVDDLHGRLEEEADEFQERLERASDELRVELGRVAVRAQRSPQALNALAREIRRQKETIGN